MTNFEETTVPKQALISHAIALAYENTEWQTCFPEGWHKNEADFDLYRDTTNYDVDIIDDVTVRISGDVDTSYARQTRRAKYGPAEHAAPAEYETIEVEGRFHIDLVLEDLGGVTHVEVDAWRV